MKKKVQETVDDEVTLEMSPLSEVAKHRLIGSDSQGRDYMASSKLGMGPERPGSEVSESAQDRSPDPLSCTYEPRRNWWGKGGKRNPEFQQGRSHAKPESYMPFGGSSTTANTDENMELDDDHNISFRLDMSMSPLNSASINPAQVKYH